MAGLVRNDAGEIVYRVEDGDTATQRYEYAAWYTEHALQAGDYPVEHVQNGRWRYYRVSIPSVIVDEEMGSYFGGVRVGEGSTGKDIGKASTYTITWNGGFWWEQALKYAGLLESEAAR